MNPSFLLFQFLKPFLEDSKYRNLLPLFVGHNLLLVSEEPKVKEMVRILKSVPLLPLLGEQAPLPGGWGGGAGEGGGGPLWRGHPLTDGASVSSTFVEGCLCLLTPVMAHCLHPLHMGED